MVATNKLASRPIPPTRRIVCCKSDWHSTHKS